MDVLKVPRGNGSRVVSAWVSRIVLVVFLDPNVSADHLLLETHDSDFPDTSVQLNVRQTGDQFGLNSLTVTASGHHFSVSFDPALPLPAAMAKDTTQVAFTMEEDGLPDVASGRLSAIRGLGNEHLEWQFSSPDWAKPKRLDTGVNILFEADTKDLKKSSTVR